MISEMMNRSQKVIQQGESAEIISMFWYKNNIMMTSSNGNIFPAADPLYREFTGHRQIPCTKASDAELWCFLWPAPE